MENSKLFSRKDVLKINSRMISESKSTAVPPDSKSGTMREVHFSRQQINSAFAVAREKANKER